MAASTEIERLIVRMVGDATSYQKMMRDAQKEAKRTGQVVETQSKKIERIGKSLRKFGASASKLGRTLSLKLTAPLTILGGFSVRAFAQFDNAMTQSTSIMKVTTAQMQEMRDVALSLSGAAAQAPKELAESYFFLASAGKSAEQAMALLPRIVEFSTAGAFDMALATDLLTDAQSALGLATKNVAKDTENLIRVSDVLVKGNTLANSSVQQLSTALTTKAGAAMKSLNIELEQGTAVLLAFADQGIKGELAGNNFSRMLLLMSKGSRDNTKEWEKLGFSLFDARGNVREMADVIKNLEDVTKGMSAKAKTFTLDMLGFDARVQGAILPLLGTSDAIRRYTKELRNAKGITKEVSDKQMKSFSNQMKILRNRLTVVGIEIGEALVPVIKMLSSVLKGAMFIWNSFNGVTKSIIVTIGLLVAAIGPLLIVFGSLLSLVGFAATGYATLTANTVALKIATIGLKGAFVGVLGLGVVVFFSAVSRAVASANKELDASLKKLDSLEESNRRRLEKIEDPNKQARAVAANRKRLLANLVADQAALAAEEQRQRGEFGRGGKTRLQERKSLGIDEFDFFDPAVPLRKNIEKSEKLLKDFDNWQDQQNIKRLEKDSTALEKALNESIRNRADAAEKVFAAEAKLADIREIQEKTVRTVQGGAKVKRPTLIPEAAKAEKEVTTATSELRQADAFIERARRKIAVDKETQKVAEERARAEERTTQKILSLFGMKNEAVDSWSRKFVSATKIVIAKSEEQEKAMREGARVTEQFLTPQIKFLNRLRRLQQLFDVGEITQPTLDRAVKSAQEEFASATKETKKKKTTERFGLGRVTGARFGSLEAQQRVAEFRSLRGSGEKEGVAKTNELLGTLVEQGEADVDPKLVIAAGFTV